MHFSRFSPAGKARRGGGNRETAWRMDDPAEKVEEKDEKISLKNGS
jgi:hypothetical protein